jgi:protein ImuB
MPFAAIHIPNFSIQAAVRAEPTLRDRALVLIAGAAPLWNVVAASAAAQCAGIQLGMTKAQVTEFTNVEIRERCEVHETAAHAALLDAAWSVSPRVEDTAADTIVLDLDGLESLFGAQENIAQELIWRAGRVGVAANVAVASNIDSAIVAARGFSGVIVIAAGEESERLGGLPVNVLMVPTETTEILERWGIRTLGALVALPVLRLSERLGQLGVQLHALACGSSRRSLVLAEPSLRFEEEMELDESVEELEPLSFLLGRLLDQLCARLEARALALRAVHVWFALEPSFEKSVQAGDDASREKSAPKEYRKLLTLPVPMRDSKMLLKLLRLQLQGDPPAAPIQKILLSGDAAAPRVAQSGLFVPKGPDPEKLELTVARLAKLVGEGNVGVAELLDTHRAENFRMSKFASVVEHAKRPRKNGDVAIGGAASSIGLGGEFSSAPHGTGMPAAFRIIRPSVPVRVELREHLPVRVFFRGVSGRVTIASGPWRSSGDWWQEDSWDCDEWDLAIDFGAVTGNRAHRDDSLPECGVYRVFYDDIKRGWFVRGFYD